MSKKFVKQLGVLLGTSSSSSKSRTRKSYTRKSARRTPAQKREEGALLFHQEIERRKEQGIDGQNTEKRCEYCLTLIPVDAKFCPNPNCRMSKPLSRWFLLIIFFVGLFVTIKCSVP